LKLEPAVLVRGLHTTLRSLVQIGAVVVYPRARRRGNDPLLYRYVSGLPVQLLGCQLGINLSLFRASFSGQDTVLQSAKLLFSESQFTLILSELHGDGNFRVQVRLGIGALQVAPEGQLLGSGQGSEQRVGQP